MQTKLKLKNVLVRKYFGPKMFGSKMILGQKYFWVRKFFGQQNFESKEILSPKEFGFKKFNYEKCLDEQNLGPNKIKVQKIFG